MDDCKAILNVNYFFSYEKEHFTLKMLFILTCNEIVNVIFK